MTLEEFNAAQNKILEDLPAEVRSAVSLLAYDRGHAYGYEEVLNHLDEMVSTLKEPITAYGLRMAQQGFNWGSTQGSSLGSGSGSIT
jgi:hypothetical protein